MNDDEFLSQFRKSPRPEFTAALRAALAQQEASEEREIPPMTVTPAPEPSAQIPSIKVARPRNRYMPLIAACLLVVFVGVALVLNTPPAQMPVPLVPMGLPNQSIISPNNAAQLHPIAQIGNGSIFDAVWSPDGKWLVMAGSMGLWVYDAADLTKPLYNIYPEIFTYTYVAFSGDSRIMVVDSNQGLKIWNLAETRDITSTFSRVPLYPGAIELNSDGSLLAVSEYAGTISFFNVQTGEQLLQIPSVAQDTPTIDMQFSPDDKQLAFLSEDMPVFVVHDPSGLWNNAENKTPERRLSGKIDEFQSMNYSHDGTRLAGRAGNTVIIWDATTGQEIQRFQSTASENDSATAVYAIGGDLSFSPDSTQLMTLGNQIRFWDLASESSHTLPGSDAGLYYTSLGLIHIKPDWSQVSIVMRGGLVHIHDVDTGDSLVTIDDYTLSNINEFVLSADGTRMVTAGDLRQVVLWDIRDILHVPQPTLLLEGFDADFYDGQRFVFSPKDDTLTTYLSSGNIQRWSDENVPAQQWTVPSYQRDTSRGMQGFIAYNADGTRLLSNSPDGARIWLWDTESGTVIQTLDLDPSQVATVGALSPDGQQIAIAMNVEEKKVVDKVNNIEWMTVAKAIIVLYDAATGKMQQTLEFHGAQIHRLIYSPDGKTLLSGALDGSMYLWDIAADEKTTTLPQQDLTQSFAFSPDGRLIAGIECVVDKSSCDLVLWDAASQTSLLRLHEAALIQDMAFSADGTRVFTALNNGTVKVWGLQ